MKRRRLLFLLLVLGLGSLVAPVSARADGREFTVGDVRGSYGFSWIGTLGGTPASADGLLVSDGEGNFTEAVRTLSVGGPLPLHQTATGTYTVNPNGTGSATLNVNGEAAPEHFEFVIVDNGREAPFIGTDPGVVIRGVAVKQ
jgi:hypothetical protein